MSSSFQFQLAVELTKLFPLRQAVDHTYNGIVKFARDLRKSGSDFLVEEDLADIFGRGIINRDLEERFREAVVKDCKVTGVGRSNGPPSQLVLDSTLGPSLERALTRDPTKAYLATMIQLSLLTWMHGRESLAACISECMHTRYLAGAPGATESPDMETIQGILDNCASQTGAFQWSRFAEQVEARMLQACPDLFLNFRRSKYTTLRPKQLLGCMDCLFIVQRLPGDRIVIVDSEHGAITLVIWAHYCLGLSVLLEHFPGGDIAFGVTPQSPPQVIIRCDQGSEPGVRLFDGDMRLLLEPSSPDQLRIEAFERLPLEDYGTTVLWRSLNRNTTTVKNSPLFLEAVQWVLASAIAKLPYLFRFFAGPGGTPTGHLQIHRWQVYELARVMFASSSYSEADVERYVRDIDGRQPLLKCRPPPALARLYNWDYQPADEPPQSPMVHPILLLVVVVIAFASVARVESCAGLPLTSDLGRLARISLVRHLTFNTAPQEVRSMDTYEVVTCMMVGPSSNAEHSVLSRCFMVSEYGWTAFLSSVETEDPSLVSPGQIFVQQGVPTKASTKERRYRVRDSPATYSPGFANSRQILDHEGSFVPRCVEQVVKRVEYYGISRDDFQLMIRHHLKPHESSTSHLPKSHDISMSFGFLHQALWRSLVAPPCEHDPETCSGGTVPLPSDVSAGTMLSKGYDTITSRIIIALVQGDPHARWLAVALSPRRVMIRGQSTCVSCAIDAAVALPGEWLVVI